LSFLKAILWLFAMVVFPCLVTSQVDSVLLNSVEITAVQYRLKPNSTLESLSEKSHKIILKDYGPANISTISMRGGNASQVQVSWNGVELNNPMLGLTDLSIINPNLLNEISVSSSIRGFSGISGELNLESNSSEHITPKLGLELGMKIKSFNSNDFHLKTSFSKKQYGLSLSAIAAQALNNYKFPSESENKQFGNSEVRRNGFMLSQFFQTKKLGKFEWHVWGQSSFNEIPPTVVQSSSSAFQFDRFLRSQLHHRIELGKNHLTTVFSHAYNENDFTDSLNLEFAENRFTRLHAHSELERESSNWTQKLKILVEKLNAFSKNYEADRSREIVSGQYSLAKKFNRNKIQVNGKASLIDQKLFSAYQLFADIYLGRDLFIFSGVSQTFRAPTLNDLYWRPGGNINLLPEQAQAAELGLKKLIYKNNSQATFELTAYSRHTKNWMLWVFNPELNYWSAANINEVSSRGIEAQMKLKKRISSSSNLQLNFGGQYVKSVFKESLSLPDIEEGSQLYYVPRLSANTELGWQYKLFKIEHSANYRSSQEGVLYTISQFTVQDFSLSRTMKTKSAQIAVGLTAKNIFNTRYEMVEYRPLPGRHFEIEIHLKSK